MIDVFIKINGNNEVIDIKSSIFLDDTSGYIKIAQGYGDNFAHADTQYLPKSLTDDYGHYNYIYSNDNIQER